MTSLSTDIIQPNDLKANEQQPSFLHSTHLDTTGPTDFKDDITKGADFWYYDIGANVIPAKSKNKQPNIPSREFFQHHPVIEEQYERWKKKGAFNQGLAVVAGKLWRGPNKDKHLVCIDCDNKKGIDEFLTHYSPDPKNLEELSQNTIVEQHLDNREKAHIYFILGTPLTNRGSLNGTIDKEDSIPAIEVKSGGKSCVICSPSLHKDGCRYEIIGTNIPQILDINQSQILQDNLNQIYEKYGDAGIKNNGGKPSIDELYKDDFAASEGSRSNCLLRLMTSLLRRNKNKPPENLKQDVYEWKQIHCRPPLDNNKVEYQWGCALRYYENDKVYSPTYNKGSEWIEKQINVSPEVYYYADPGKKRIGRYTIEFEKNEDGESVEKVNYSNIIIDAIPKKIFVYKDNPLLNNASERIKIIFESSRGEDVEIGPYDDT